ncbi:MAG: hypothetical protein J2P29_16760 [Actinobacteria bacterium]|nr:hypothetical protein [Actinomycetota bacterium]
MSKTDRTTCQPGLAARYPADMLLREGYYRALVPLAALLIGDPEAAEEIAAGALAAAPRRLLLSDQQNEATLRFLQRQVVIRCRRRPADAKVPNCSDETEFAHLPVVSALQELPPPRREAVVLRLYLDLSEQQAASVAGVARAAMRKQLGCAMRTLQERLPRA